MSMVRRRRSDKDDFEQGTRCAICRKLTGVSHKPHAEPKEEPLAVGFYWVRLTDYGSVLTVGEWLGAEWHFTGTDEAQPPTKVVVVKAIPKP